MVQTGVAAKEQNSLSKKIRSYFERVRVAYLSARDDPRSYKKKWAKVIEDIKGQWDDTDTLATAFKKFLNEDDLFAKDVNNPQSVSANRVYESIKLMRYSSISNDPFTAKFGKNVLPSLLKDAALFAQFIHWSTRNDERAI